MVAVPFTVRFCYSPTPHYSVPSNVQTDVSFENCAEIQTTDNFIIIHIAMSNNKFAEKKETEELLNT